jgi:ribonuclease BN (tRNA processing enzyme)
LKVAFATHLHSDHTVGYPDLILTGWTAGRRTPLEVYGPTGLQSMTDRILQAWRIDIARRPNPDGLRRGIPDDWKMNAHEIKSGVVYKDAKATVTAFPTKQAMESYGYRFDTPDRSIVISGAIPIRRTKRSKPAMAATFSSTTGEPRNSSPGCRRAPAHSWRSFT